MLKIIQESCEEEGAEATVELVDSLERKQSQPLARYIEKENFFSSSGLRIVRLTIVPPVSDGKEVDVQPRMEDSE
jgi:hypothetical protein